MVQKDEPCLQSFGQKNVKEWNNWTTYADTEC